MSEIPTVDTLLEFGQGDDDVVFELFKGVHQMMQGYYTLFNYGDEWWEALNQDVWCDKMISDAFEKVDWEAVEEALEITYKVMCGSYVREPKLFEALEIINEKGIGFRPQRKEQLKEQI